MIHVTRDFFLTDADVDFTASKSSGPGGQNVNKVNTRVTVLFNVLLCEKLSGSEKRRILSRLSGRAGKDGVVRVVSQRHRTQKANRDFAFQRLGELLAESLKRKKFRVRTKLPKGVKRRRADDKKRRGEIKRQRKLIE